MNCRNRVVNSFFYSEAFFASFFVLFNFTQPVVHRNAPEL